MVEVQPEKLSDATEGMIDLLVDIPLFDKLEGEELQTILKYMNLIEVKKGEYVFREGEKGSYMCFVVQGQFDILKKPLKGASVPISALRKGQSVGEMSIIDSYPRSATVRAKTDGALFTLNRKSFQLLLDQNPRNTNYYGRKEVGAFLQSVLEKGATQDWRELMREVLGEELSAQPMLDYYQPLLEWLREENTGRSYTLPETL